MMSKLGLMLIVTSLISTASVSAEDLSFDISQLISWCRQPDGTQNRGLCLGYVQAMASAVAHEFVLLRVDDKVEVLENPLPAAQHHVCVPREMGANQLAGVFLQLTDKHPELLNMYPSTLVARAIAEAFPCPPK
jgi:hypothetical protein